MCDYSKWDKFTDADSDSDSESASLFSGLNRFVQSLGPKADGGAHPWEAPADVAQDRPLRFAVGDAVDVLVGDDQGRLGGDWRRGVVAAVRCPAREWPPGARCPYRVTLESGGDVACPRDDDSCVRASARPPAKPAPADLGGALAAGLSACDEATAFYSGALVAAAARAAAPRSTAASRAAPCRSSSPSTRPGRRGARNREGKPCLLAVAGDGFFDDDCAAALCDELRGHGATADDAAAGPTRRPPPGGRRRSRRCWRAARTRRGGARQAAPVPPRGGAPGPRLVRRVAPRVRRGRRRRERGGRDALCFALHHDHADAARLAAGADPLHDLARLSRRKRLEDAGATARAYVDHWVTAATEASRGGARFDHGAVDDELARALEKAQSGTAKAAQLRFLLEEARATLAPIRDADAPRPAAGAARRESDASSEGDAAPAPGSDDDAPAPPEADDDAAVVGLLRGLDLLRLLPRFRQHEIDGASLPYLTCDDYVQMGVPTGPRRRILCAVAAARPAGAAPPPSPLPVAASWHCPISMDVMREPVVCACGNTFERSFIAAWLTTNDTSPVTGEVLPHKMLVPNHSMRSDIQEWHDECKRAGGAPPSPTRAAQQRRRDPEDA
ncbi:ubiquitin-protein transferase [Aureococcus anophagefferens]|nr:ubiquitin-protein transferase [Aureococcus anophagefferens]